MGHAVLSRITFLLVLFLLIPQISLAHDPGLSSARVMIDGDRIAATLRFNAADLPNTTTERQALLASSLAFSAAGVALEPETVRILAAGPQHFRVELATRTSNAEAIRVESTLFDRLPHGHRQVLRIEGPAGAVLGETILSADAPDLEIDVTSADGTARARGHFLGIGFEHILGGWDHLLFLMVMLIGCRRLVDVVHVVTLFTLAHSATLALSTLTQVQLPASIVEPAIAFSIVFAAIRNLRSGGVGERGALTFGFGLIHGLGFAGQLAGLGVSGDAWGVVWPLLEFNLGVELGQLAVASLMVPLLAWIRRFALFSRFGVPAVSLAAALLGFTWLIERLAIS